MIKISDKIEIGIYKKLYTTTLINLISDSVAHVALPLAFLYATGSVSAAASLATASLVTQLVLALPLAAIADCLPRRPIVILAYFIEAISLSVLAGMLYMQSVSILALIILGFIRGGASQLSVSATAGYLPQLLGRESMLKFNSRVETVEGVAAIGGPSLSGGLVGLLGGPLSLLVPSIMSIFNALVYKTLPDTEVPEKLKGKRKIREVLSSIIPDIWEGILYVLRSPSLVVMQLVQIALGLTTAGYIYGVLVHLKHGLELETWLVGILVASTGVGGIVASLLLEKVFPISQYRSVLIVSLASIAFLLSAFSFIDGIWIAAIALFALDFFWVAIFIYSGTLTQYITDDAYLARVDSVSDLSFLSASAVSVFLASWVLDGWGTGTYLSIISLSVLPAFLTLLLWVRNGKGEVKKA